MYILFNETTGYRYSKGIFYNFKECSLAATSLSSKKRKIIAMKLDEYLEREKEEVRKLKMRREQKPDHNTDQYLFISITSNLYER